LITNDNDEILEANENIARLSQYGVDELTGKPLSRILNLKKKVYYHVDDRDEDQGDLFESEVICKDGETIPANFPPVSLMKSGIRCLPSVMIWIICAGKPRRKANTRRCMQKWKTD